MGKKILISGVHGLLDSGEDALLLGAITNVKKLHPDSEFYLGSTMGEVDEIQLEKIFGKFHKDIKLINGICSPKIPWIIRSASLMPVYLFTYFKCDIGLHIGADGYSDIVLHNKISLLSPLIHSYQLLLGRLFSKPNIACSMSIGPFNSKFSQILARYTLNNTTLITVREEITKDYLQNLGVKNSTYLVADLAFLMDPDYENIDLILSRLGIDSNEPIAAIAPSELIFNRFMGSEKAFIKRQRYVKLMTTAVDYLSDKNFKVLILCQTSGDRHDDRSIAREIQKNSKIKPLVLDNREYTPQQIKAIMSRCALTISSKLHSSIASTSVLTPTITLAYHPKIYGIIGDMLGLENFIIDVRSVQSSEIKNLLIFKIDECLRLREKIHEQLSDIIPKIKDKAFYNIICIDKLLKY